MPVWLMPADGYRASGALCAACEGGAQAGHHVGGGADGATAHGDRSVRFPAPFASDVQTVFETSPNWQPFWRAYHLDLPARLRAAGIACLPLSVPQQDGFDDRYMYDGYHPTEIYAAALVKQIVQQAAPHSLLREVDLAYLDALLSGTYATPLSFERPPLSSEDE